LLATRILIAALLIPGMIAPLGAVGADGPGLFNLKPRLDQSRVRFLAELLRSDPDEKKRRAAVAELGDADPRAHPEVMSALITALKKDAAAVRASAAEVIGKFKNVFPLAGNALESAAESDPDPRVRTAAKQALWDYHLNGYRSAKSAETAITQTAEPPFARTNSPRPPLALAPMPTAVRNAVATAPTARLPEVTLVPSKVVPAAAIGPRVRQTEGLNASRYILSLPVRPSLPSEPPLAKRPTKWVPPHTPSTASEPPIFIRLPDLGTYGDPPKMIFDLPPVVSNPGPQPGTKPLPDPTTEPPVRKVSNVSSR